MNTRGASRKSGLLPGISSIALEAGAPRFSPSAEEA